VLLIQFPPFHFTGNHRFLCHISLFPVFRLSFQVWAW
jgi:hypothetical protein